MGESGEKIQSGGTYRASAFTFKYRETIKILRIFNHKERKGHKGFCETWSPFVFFVPLVVVFSLEYPK
jgi:hypothetical protein